MNCCNSIDVKEEYQTFKNGFYSKIHKKQITSKKSHK